MCHSCISQLVLIRHLKESYNDTQTSLIEGNILRAIGFPTFQFRQLEPLRHRYYKFLRSLTTWQEQGITTQDITNINQSITQIQQDLARQTHFRGYYLLNADIINLPSSASGDFAFSAESGTVWMYESEWYDSGQLVPDQVTPASDELPIIYGTAAAGNSTSYSRGDHIHPQQLTYDNDITATKFIKTGGTATEILLANGDTTTIDSKISRTYNSGTGGYIRLCVFPTGTSTGAPYIQFQVTCNTNAIGNVTVTVSKQSTYWPTRVTEILTQDIVSSITGSQTQIPMSFNLGDGGIISNMLQVNPTDRNYTIYSNGIRIGNNNGDSTSSSYLGCIKTATNTTQAGQWEISKTNDKALTINQSSLRQTDHSVGLSINSDSSIIKFNNNQLVDVGTDQTITGKKTINNVLKINPTSSDYTEGIRIARSSNGQCSGIYLGCDPNSTSGTMEGQWNIVNTPDGQLQFGVNTQIGQPNQGLLISADGNTLSFNGSVIAGTGAQVSSNGSVNYSAGNPILWGLNSVDTNGGFYSDGPKVYWRAKPVTLGAVPP
ncbi:MAG: hypothetical protein EZS28_018169 [Streblomastix strix]|uniref:Uncharacterized protein n=1 Tax=Streblomastix strix TaxID=222440 RepID=A0A5J4VV84_9EUKA|nr:MAG: hypothetical protein EZS28_018169 [Streblomastix strix]